MHPQKTKMLRKRQYFFKSFFVMFVDLGRVSTPLALSPLAAPLDLSSSMDRILVYRKERRCNLKKIHS